MNSKWFSVNPKTNTLTLSIYIQPGAKKTFFSGLHGESLKLKLAARAQENQANETLLRYLSHVFEVPLSLVKIKRGEKSRHKQIEIKDSLIHPLTILKKSS